MVIQYWSTLIGAFVLTTRGGDFALYIGEFGPAVNKSHREHLPLRRLFFIYLT